jgi:hypothetical protein
LFTRNSTILGDERFPTSREQNVLFLSRMTKIQQKVFKMSKIYIYIFFIETTDILLKEMNYTNEQMHGGHSSSQT